MSYLSQKSPSETTGPHKKLFDQIQSVFGTVPNMFKTIGHSPAALESMWSSFGALGKGRLGSKLGEQIAVLVADINRCEYCLAAHTLLGQNAGLTVAEMTSAQAGESKDPRTMAALQFAAKLVKNRAQITANDVAMVRQAGFSDEEIAEILAHVALNIFTNYTNVAFNVPVDFPKVSLRNSL
jgi:uncharacterized peroxidase-related enzyme